jgi:hypothetical protein
VHIPIASCFSYLAQIRTLIGACEMKKNPIVILSVFETQDGYANHEVEDKNAQKKLD